MWSFRIGRIAGIDISVHVTFLILLAFCLFQGVGVALFVATLFGCILLHELGHALTARAFGIGTRGIVLLPIGGVAKLERMPRNPKHELLVALAGPAVNFVLAGLLCALLFLANSEIPLGFDVFLESETPRNEVDDTSQPDFLSMLLLANIFLGLFNLLPAFPMDGGRVLRAILAMRMDYLRATLTAAAVGKVFAAIFFALGLVTQHFGLMLLAIFVWLMGTAEATMVKVAHKMEDLPDGGPFRATMTPEESRSFLRDYVSQQRAAWDEAPRRERREAEFGDTRGRKASDAKDVRDVPFTLED